MKGQRRPPALLPDYLTIFSVLTVLLVILGAAFVGPFSATPVLDARENSAPSLIAPEPAESGPQPEPADPDSDPVSSDGGISVPLLLVFALAVTALIVRFLLSFRRDDVETKPYANYTDVDGAGPVIAGENVSHHLDRAAAALAGPADSSNAVLHCWVELEQATSQAGVPRLPHQTTSEYTAHVLAAFDAPPDRVRQLQRLYLRVRFAADGGTPHISAAELTGAQQSLLEINDAVTTRLRPGMRT